MIFIYFFFNNTVHNMQILIAPILRHVLFKSVLLKYP